MPVRMTAERNPSVQPPRRLRPAPTGRQRDRGSQRPAIISRRDSICPDDRYLANRRLLRRGWCVSLTAAQINKLPCGLARIAHRRYRRGDASFTLELRHGARGDRRIDRTAGSHFAVSAILAHLAEVAATTRQVICLSNSSTLRPTTNARDALPPRLTPGRWR